MCVVCSVLLPKWLNGPRKFPLFMLVSTHVFLGVLLTESPQKNELTSETMESGTKKSLAQHHCSFCRWTSHLEQTIFGCIRIVIARNSKGSFYKHPENVLLD